MKCYSRYNSAEAKQKRSDRASRAAQKRWDDFHAQFDDDPIMQDPPQDQYRLTFENLMTGKVEVLTFHPGTRKNNKRIDVNGKFWRVSKFGFEEFMLCRKGLTDDQGLHFGTTMRLTRSSL